jgi:hypothetical protein
MITSVGCQVNVLCTAQASDCASACVELDLVSNLAMF